MESKSLDCGMELPCSGALAFGIESGLLSGGMVSRPLSGGMKSELKEYGMESWSGMRSASPAD